MASEATAAQRERARELHRAALVVDATVLGHAAERHFLERMWRQGGVDCCLLSVQGRTFEHTARALAAVLEDLAECADLAVLATNVAAIRQAKREGKLAVVLATQSASLIGEDLGLLRALRQWGYRSLGPSYSGANLLADGCGEQRDAGLSYLGREFVAEMNRLGLLIDCAHVGDASTRDCLRLSRQPIAFTHANARALADTPRNKPDELSKLLAARGGVQGLTAVPRLVCDDPRRATLAGLLDHCDYLKRLVGVAHIGLGLDFTDAAERGVTLEDFWGSDAHLWRQRRPDLLGTVVEWALPYPEGLRHSGELPNLTLELVVRGYTDAEIFQILGENWLRLLAQLES